MKSKEWTADERDLKSKLSKGLKPTDRWAVGGWTDEQLALLGTDDEVIVARVGRTKGAARAKRAVPVIRAGGKLNRGRLPKD
jgi:hypothetical protein